MADSYNFTVITGCLRVYTNLPSIVRRLAEIIAELKTKYGFTEEKIYHRVRRARTLV